MSKRRRKQHTPRWGGIESYFTWIVKKKTVLLGTAVSTRRKGCKWVIVARMSRVGFEPTANGLKVRCSTRLSYRPMRGQYEKENGRERENSPRGPRRTLGAGLVFFLRGIETGGTAPD